MNDHRVYTLILVAIEATKNDIMNDCMQYQSRYGNDIDHALYKFLPHLEQLRRVCNDRIANVRNTYWWFAGINDCYDSTNAFIDIIDQIKYSIFRGQVSNSVRQFIDVGRYSRITWNLLEKERADYEALFLRIKLLLAVEYRFTMGIRAIVEHETAYVQKNTNYGINKYVRFIINKICAIPDGQSHGFMPELIDVMLRSSITPA